MAGRGGHRAGLSLALFPPSCSPGSAAGRGQLDGRPGRQRRGSADLAQGSKQVPNCPARREHLGSA